MPEIVSIAARTILLAETFKLTDLRPVTADVLFLGRVVNIVDEGIDVAVWLPRELSIGL